MKRRQSARRPSWQQQLWERALLEHIFQHHELPHAVRLNRPTANSRGQHSGRPSRCTRRRGAQRQRYEAPQNPRRPRRARLVRRRDGPVEDRAAMEHAAVLVRSPAPVPQDVRRDQPTAGNAAHQQQHRSARRLCCHPQTMTMLSEHTMRVTDVLCFSALTIRGSGHQWLDAEGLGVRHGKWRVQRLLRGMRFSHKKPAKCVKELHSREQQHANTKPSVHHAVLADGEARTLSARTAS